MNASPPRFALIGAAGFVAPRHLRAMREAGGELLAALDPHDAVGVLDGYFPEARFFTEFERFDRHLDKLKRKREGADYIAICSPNYLHDAHVRFALRSKAHAICEKPLVLNPWNVDGLADMERETGYRTYAILQLRLHPAIVALKARMARTGGAKHEVELTYVTARGRWYRSSWKGDEPKAGGIATNIGIHFLFVGDGVRRPGVESLVADPGVRRHVTITGLIDPEEAPLHLAASDILVSPHVRNVDGSPFFGSPTKLFEYLAAGRPVVGSDLGQIGEVLGACPRIGDLGGAQPHAAAGDACGIRVAPENPAELAAAIRFLAEHPDWRAAAGRNARAVAVGRYTWKHHVGAVLDGLARARSAAAKAHPPRLRVLFNGLHAKTGGGLTYLRNMLPHLAAAPGVELHLCIGRDQRDDFAGAIPNLAVHPIDVAPGLWPVQIAEQFEVPKLARRIGADVVFSPANYGPLLVRRSVIMLRNALSVAFVERRPAKLAYWALVYLGTLASMLRATRVIAVSDYARRAASGGLIGLLADRLTVVPHGVSPAFSPPAADARRERFLLVVSDLYVQKNLKRLVGAFARLKAAHPDVVLKIAGRPVDSQYSDELKQLVRDEGLADRVAFLGNLPAAQLVEMYRRCAVFVFPSTTETFGNPLVEAMACGAPIACSDRAAMPEIVGDAAAYFDPRDVEAMAATIDALLKDTARCAALGRKAIERAKRYSWERTAERTLAVLRLAADRG